MAVAVGTLADDMYNLVVECQGKRSLKALDLTKAMLAKYGEAECGKQNCKQAIRQLIDSGRCVYAYFGGSFITLPHREGAEPE